MPDGTIPTLLANLQGLDRSNQEQLASLEARADWAGIVVLADRNIQRDPTTPDWWFAKGYAQARLGEWREARKAFAETVRLEPDNLQAWHMLAQSERFSGDASRAAQTLERLLGASRESPVTFYLLGETYAELDRRKQAAAAYREALRLDPSFPEALYGLGMMHARAGERAEQLTVATRLQKLNPELAQRLLNSQ